MLSILIAKTYHSSFPFKRENPARHRPGRAWGCCYSLAGSSPASRCDGSTIAEDTSAISSGVGGCSPLIARSTRFSRQSEMTSSILSVKARAASLPLTGKWLVVEYVRIVADEVAASHHLNGEGQPRRGRRVVTLAGHVTGAVDLQVCCHRSAPRTRFPCRLPFSRPAAIPVAREARRRRAGSHFVASTARRSSRILSSWQR